MPQSVPPSGNDLGAYLGFQLGQILSTQTQIVAGLQRLEVLLQKPPPPALPAPSPSKLVPDWLNTQTIAALVICLLAVGGHLTLEHAKLILGGLLR